MNKIKVNDNIVFGDKKLVIVAGPCAIEDDISITMKTAEELKKTGVKNIFVLFVVLCFMI